MAGLEDMTEELYEKGWENFEGLKWRRVPCKTAIGHELVNHFFEKPLKAKVEKGSM